MLTSYFHVCKLWVLPLKTDIWWNVKTHLLVIVLTGPKNMPICHAVFHCELFPWFIFLAECEILNFVDAGRCMHTASLRGWPLACYQINGLKLPVMSVIFIKKFHSINIPLSVQCPKHVAWTFGYITLADLQAFYQMSVFNGKTHNLQT